MHVPETDADGRLTRRSTLVRAGGLAVVALGSSSLPAEAGESATESGLACVLSPELTEGPYYIDGAKLRRNITEGQPGAPLVLRLSVLGATTCKPIKGAVVDIWHASAGGTYSGEQANNTAGRTYLRGIQRTDANGLALFKTVYPGWYAGRAVHIHVKVHVGGDVVHTGQLFFRDAFTARVYKRAPYKARGGPDMRNADDSIYAGGGSRSLLHMRTAGKGYVGSISMACAPERLPRTPDSPRRRRVGVLDADHAGIGASLAEVGQERSLGDRDRRLRRTRRHACREREPPREPVADDGRLTDAAGVLELPADAVGERRQISAQDRGRPALHVELHQALGSPLRPGANSLVKGASGGR
jgi:protocatechuate 3,4-dioxygenase beta subunit